MIARRVLLTLRRGVLRLLSIIDSAAAEPIEREQLLSEEELLKRAKDEDQKARRAARRPWYYSRPGEVQIPESLRYYEAVHGTRATVAMIKRAGRKLDD